MHNDVMLQSLKRKQSRNSAIGSRHAEEHLLNARITASLDVKCDRRVNLDEGRAALVSFALERVHALLCSQGSLVAGTDEVLLGVIYAPDLDVSAAHDAVFQKLKYRAPAVSQEIDDAGRGDLSRDDGAVRYLADLEV